MYTRGPLFGDINPAEIAKQICEFLVGNQGILEDTNFRNIAEDFNDNFKAGKILIIVTKIRATT